MINVTKTFLPPMSEYTRLLEDVWKSAHVTNHGPLVVRLERALAERLGARHCFFVGNGTLALQIAIKALELRGQIITTPFSYVATTSSIVWEGCQPVFVDIQPDTLTLDPALIEAAITQDTRAILATHVYGNPCDVDEIARIAAKNSLRVIYDGAHAFDIAYQGKPISSFGDITTFSFHATKLFHTVEG
ncbi:MAG TPA: DegT/DnrJ/EryC1/StrS family aminotransferase, partial [Thermoflexales bacterium]|nr:DegT/DnrJ/EryC1/StrS family aminotransferase [Thermoflexales bacterium]